MNKKYIKIRVLVTFWGAKVFLFLLIGLLAFVFLLNSCLLLCHKKIQRYEPFICKAVKLHLLLPVSTLKPPHAPRPWSPLARHLTYSSHHSCSTATDLLQHSLPLAYNSLSPSIASGPAQGSPAAQQDKGNNFIPIPVLQPGAAIAVKTNLTVTL